MVSSVMEYKGLDSAPKILTEDDVLLHCYGVQPAPRASEEPAPEATLAPAPSEPAPEEVMESTPDADSASETPDLSDADFGSVIGDVVRGETDVVSASASDEPIGDVPDADALVEPIGDVAPVVELTAEEKLMVHTKAQLVDIANSLGIDSSGNKVVLAARIAEKQAKG